MNPKYPVYIISKGRWERRLTSKALEKMDVPYRIGNKGVDQFGHGNTLCFCDTVQIWNQFIFDSGAIHEDHLLGECSVVT